MAGASMDSGKDQNAFVAQLLDQQHEEAPCYTIATLSISMLHQRCHLHMLLPRHPHLQPECVTQCMQDAIQGRHVLPSELQDNSTSKTEHHAAECSTATCA